MSFDALIFRFVSSNTVDFVAFHVLYHIVISMCNVWLLLSTQLQLLWQV